MTEKKFPYKIVVGLEIHLQLSTIGKAFTAEAYSYGTQSNTCVSAYALGLPGVLPKPNQELIKKGLLLGFTLNSQLKLPISFSRKNYFYPDMPKAYQITQTNPLFLGGELYCVRKDGSSFSVHLQEIHMEEDAAKSNYEAENILLDYNRSGVPLLEVVTDPVIHSSEDAKCFLRALKRHVRFYDLSNCDMDKGSLRCDVNVSIEWNGQRSNRVEIKNLNSYSAAGRCIDLEAERHYYLLRQGENTKAQTLTYDIKSKKLNVLRDKSEWMDYRFIHENDMAVIRPDNEMLNQVKECITLDPNFYLSQLCNTFNIPYLQAIEICDHPDLLKMCCRLQNSGLEVKGIVRWLINELKPLVINSKSINGETFYQEIFAFLKWVQQTSKSNFESTTVFKIWQERESSIEQVLEEISFEEQKEDSDLIKKYILEFPEELEKYKAGKKALLGFFIGRIRNRGGVPSDPKVLKDSIKEILDTF